MSDIVIRGAREHNLRDVDLTLPRNKLICLTGVSGSGKSSLAFDTLYAEGQRRYVESLSSYARQFLGQLPKPDVDAISGLAPSISIQQKTAGRNPRSTVGTITEIHDYLRVLFARVGTGHCPQCSKPITAQSLDQILQSILNLEAGTRYSLLAPMIVGQKGEYRDLFEDLLKQGFLRARVDGVVHELSAELNLDRQMKHWIEVVVDRLVAGKASRQRVAEAVELAMKLSTGTLIVAVHVDKETTDDRLYSANYACVDCGLSFEPPSPQLFSFNSPQGMCLECNGLGRRHDFPLDRLIPDDKLSVNAGAIDPLGKLTAIGKWKKHIYRGVAEVIEKELDLPEGSFLKWQWKKQPEQAKQWFLYGMGDRQIVFRWRHSGGVWKHTGKWEGVVNRLIDDYRTAGNPMRRRQLEKYMEFAGCSSCGGERLNAQARNVRIPSRAGGALTLPEACALSIAHAVDFFEQVELDATARVIAEEALKEIRGRLGFLMKCGLDYLTLERQAPTLSGGEAQRIRLAGQIGCGLVGVVYILDEPSIGLHPRDNDKLLESLRDLRDQGNTVVVVEHDEETMRAADHIIDFGPGPGIRGGEVVAQGTYARILKSKRSETAAYLSGRKQIPIPEQRRKPGKKQLVVKKASHNNLRGIDVEIPLGLFVCVTGVFGSGKSSLTNDILWQVLNREINGGKGDPGKHLRINGLQHLDKAIDIDQSPIGRTPRSNPATYVKVFDLIRNLYATLPEAKVRGYKAGRFSFNVSAERHGGRCEACEGHGANKLEMDFLADIWVTCPVCHGHRFNHETLEIKFKGKSIADVLEMDIQEALEHFENVPKIAHLLQTLHDVGLDYMKLGQPSPTLSGGEAQRIKLARELGKRSTGSTLYLLDEPTTGLHFADIHKLLDVLQGFVENGNTVLVVEHNVDVIKTADWVIDLGPEGGERGGEVVVAGTPEDVAASKASYTGTALRAAFAAAGESSNGRATRKPRRTPEFKSITIRGAGQHNLRNVDIDIPREKMSVFCGPSGSGKSSLAMDTLYAEGQRRYVESLSAYARQFLGQMPKPKLEHVHGLSPAIAIEQKTVGSTPRSTVGTVTEIYDYLRILYTRLGKPFCPDCRKPISTQTLDDVVAKILTRDTGTRLLILAPLEIQVGQKYDILWDRLRADGFRRVRIDGETHTLDDVPSIDRRRKHDVEVVVDRVTVRPKDRSRIADSVEAAFDLGKGFVRVVEVAETSEPEWNVTPFSLHLACHDCGRSFEQLEPQNFSFNSPLGWCPSCEGLGQQHGRAKGGDESRQIVRGERSLLDGALTAWPDLNGNPRFRQMAESLAKHIGFQLTTRFDDLTAKQQRALLYGADDKWFPLTEPGKRSVIGQFQYKGVFPAMEEAGRVSYAYRHKLRDQVARVACSHCGGARLRDDAAAYRLGGKTIRELCELPLIESLAFLKALKLGKDGKRIAEDLLREATSRLAFLVDVGLDYLTLSRPMPTLSGGESQRIRLAGQIGRALTGVLYVLDEPTIGLHPRDNQRLIKTLHRLRDLGNTLVLVEHDREVLESSDRLYDFGPGAGRFGGTIVGTGSPRQLAKKTTSLTAQFLADKKTIPIPLKRRIESAEQAQKMPAIEVLGARHNNLCDVDLRIPLGTLVCVTGVSGSGKSSLIEETLAPAVARKLHRLTDRPGDHDELRGIEHINKLIVVDQSPLGNTPASNPATYTGVFDHIRELYARLPEAKVRGYRANRFSFNRSGGRCDKCEGNGQVKIEMHFLPDVWVECEDCRGERYNRETLAVEYRGRSIADVLEMSIGESAELFSNVPKIRPYLEMLCEIGLDYLTLGQAAPTLSGGEAQRVKLAAELAKPNTGSTLYLLDEPTTGLHLDDIAKLLKVLNSLVEAGNTVVVIEHNLDVIKTADWIIDLGPEAGAGGGQIVAAGTPEEIVASGDGDVPSHTARVLAPVLSTGTKAEREVLDTAHISEKRKGDVTFAQIGKSQKMPWERDGRRWHVKDRLGHNGRPPRWDGGALELVADELADDDALTEPNWNHRSVVEVKAREKASTWFLHAMTGDEWLLRLVFRVKKNTFTPEDLTTQLGLTPLEDLDDVVVNGRGNRVQIKNSSSLQVVVLLVSKRNELETPGFEQFLQSARQSYLDFATTGPIDLEDEMPWRKLGRKWHLMRKGFPGEKRAKWKLETLEELFDLFVATFPQAEVDWTGKTNVRFSTADGTLATIWTKRRAGIDVEFPVASGSVTLGMIASLGTRRNVTPGDDQDTVQIRMTALTHVRAGAFREFLKSRSQ